MDAEPIEEGMGGGNLVIAAQPAIKRPFVAEKQVIGDRQRRHEVELLINDRDAGAARVEGVANRHGLAVDVDAASIRQDGAGKDLDERALAGAVLAQEREDFAGVQRQIDAAQGMHAGVRFVDGVHVEHGGPPVFV